MKILQAVLLFPVALTLVACTSTRIESDPDRCLAACEMRYEQCIKADEAVVTVEREQYCQAQRTHCLSFCPISDTGPPRY